MKTYVLEQGEKGAERLEVLNRIMWPTTSGLLDRVAFRRGMKVLDAGCGIGQVSLELARRVGPEGSVLGMDIDATCIVRAEADARTQGLNATFQIADITHDLPSEGTFDVAFARFLLSHLTDPGRAVERMLAALKPGGMILLEDVDFSGHFSLPPHWAFDRYVELYQAAARRRGVDATIGQKLHVLLRRAGAQEIGMEVRQPVAGNGEAKGMPAITLAHIRNALDEASLAVPEEVDRAVAALQAHANDPLTILSCPRLFQVWGRRGA